MLQSKRFVKSGKQQQTRCFANQGKRFAHAAYNSIFPPIEILLPSAAIQLKIRCFCDFILAVLEH